MGKVEVTNAQMSHSRAPCNIVINNFYARLSGQYKDLLDASCSGSFTRMKEEAKWDLLETIQRNTEDCDSDKGKESGINYEYDCIKAFAETPDFQEFSAKNGLDPQIFVNLSKAFASYMNVPKGNWDIYHDPFKYTCNNNETVINNDS